MSSSYSNLYIYEIVLKIDCVKNHLKIFLILKCLSHNLIQLVVSYLGNLVIE